MKRARSRKKVHKITRQMKRLKVEGMILGLLILLYFAVQIITNAFIFHPVKVLAESDLPPIRVETKEVSVDHTFITQKQQIMAYMVEKFGDRASDLITIINQCENHDFDPEAINHNRNGSCDVGVTQENTSCSGPEFEHLKDWKYNIDEAYRKYHAAGDTFRPWTCTASVLHEPNYLGQTK